MSAVNVSSHMRGELSENGLISTGVTRGPPRGGFAL